MTEDPCRNRVSDQRSLKAIATSDTPRPPDAGALTEVHGFPFAVAASRSSVAAAMDIARRAERMSAAIARMLGCRLSLRLLVIDRPDWPHYAASPTYGVTHVDAQGALVAGAIPADAWLQFAEYLSQRLSSASLATLVDVHGSDPRRPRQPSLQQLAESLLAHDLGHLAAAQSGLRFAHRFLAEAFANYVLVAVLGETDPTGLRRVGSLAEAATQLSGDTPSLTEFEDRFGRMDIVPSVLAQLDLTRSVYGAYAAEGIAPLRRWFELARRGKGPAGDAALARLLGSHVHRGIGALAHGYTAQRARAAA